MAFHFLDKDMMRKIITTMIRSKLEYAEVIWSLHKKKHVLKLERIQRIATKMVPECPKNGLKEEIIKARSVKQIKKKLNKNRYRDRTMSVAQTLYITTR